MPPTSLCGRSHSPISQVSSLRLSCDLVNLTQAGTNKALWLNTASKVQPRLYPSVGLTMLRQDKARAPAHTAFYP